MTAQKQQFPWVPIGALAGVLAIPTMLFIWWDQRIGTDPATTTPTASLIDPSPRTSSTAPGTPQRQLGECVAADGRTLPCSAKDALLLVAATPCDRPSASRSLGVDPRVTELLIEAHAMDDACAVRPNAAARAKGALSDHLRHVASGDIPDDLLACWTTLDSSEPVTCADPHSFESVTEWRLIEDLSAIESTCRRAAAEYIAGPVDTLRTRLTTHWLTTNEETPRYRCFVGSDQVLDGSVRLLGGKPLPTVP